MFRRRTLLALAAALGAALAAAAAPPAWRALHPAPPPARQLYTPPLDEATASGLLGGDPAAHPQAADPAAALAQVRSGRAETALYVTQPGEPAPSGVASSVLGVDDTVLLQPWLDPPLSLTGDQARALLAGSLSTWEAIPGAAYTTPTVHRSGPIRWVKASPLPPPHSGELALGRAGDRHPGWLPVPVDGVLPTARNLIEGRYPLARRLLALYPPGTDPFATPAPDARARPLPAGFVPPGRLQDPITLTAVGDFMLSRAVAPLLLSQGPDFLLAGVRDALKGDIVFGNLESPIGVKGRPLPGKGIWFRAPPEAVGALKRAGVTAVTIANNHILDYDTDNFLETIEALEAAGIQHAGGGRTLAEARRPAVIEAGGVRVAIIAASAFADLYYSDSYPRRFAATETLPGVVPLREEYLAEDIRAARQVADVVLVTFHWGVEYQNFPTDEMVRIAHFCIDQGADLVLGHHPHAIQGFDLYKGKFIAYSMGNFIMDDQSLGRLTQESMILHIGLTREGVQSVAVVPVLAEHIGRPVAVQDAAAAALMEKYRRISGWDQPEGKVPGW